MLMKWKLYQNKIKNNINEIIYLKYGYKCYY